MNRIMQDEKGGAGPRATEAPPAGSVPATLDDSPGFSRRSFAAPARRPSLTSLDAVRALALTVDRFVEDPPVRTIAVLSAEVGDGRSLTAELLAVALSELRPPVRLLDADPFQRGRVRRRNRLRRLVGSRNRLEPWYSSFSGQEGALDEPAGNGDLPPFARIPLAREIFPSLSTFLHDVRAALDTEVAMGALVLIDVPACSVSSIGFAVARMADAAIYVARPGRADLEAHHKVVAQAELLNLNVLGVVFNEG